MADYVSVASIEDFKGRDCFAVQCGGHTLALCRSAGKVFAVDNRCPHMGFPMDRGTVKDGLIICHWHHARFDLCSGGTFDLWADDLRSFPVKIEDGRIYVDLSPPAGGRTHHLRRLSDGLSRNIRLVIAKSAIALLADDPDPREVLTIGLLHGARYRRDGWGMGQTILTCMANLMPHLRPEDRARAAYHGLSAVAADCEGSPPRFAVEPLTNAPNDPVLLKQWFRTFVEHRDTEAAERCIASMIERDMPMVNIADAFFSAATDHRYLSIGHVLDFTNKAFEALDLIGYEHAATILPSLVSNYTFSERMEESAQWREPIDLVALLNDAFAEMSEWPSIVVQASSLPPAQPSKLQASRMPAEQVLLGSDPRAIVSALLDALRNGAAPTDLACTVAYAAALRIKQFHTSNEFADWDTALHTFTFANAVHQALLRAPSWELTRGIFDAAMSVYLDRFLNMPAVRVGPEATATEPQRILSALDALTDVRHQVDRAGSLAAQYLLLSDSAAPFIATLCHALLREDRDFHTIQTVEIAIRQYEMHGRSAEVSDILIAAWRYLAAHAPTARAQGQTYRIAERLHRGDRLFEE
ncbi:MAG TPA: Rieske (2Fe-2S) protein [Phycisphaerae bacterium]|jgi:nitrite reductase/ring-hydroxylating ferredoxin subunit